MIDIAEEMKSILNEYTDHVIEVTSESIADVAKETASKLKQSGPRRTGKYQKSWGVVDGEKRLGVQNKVVKNKKHYRLTHLLEHGHLNRDGSRTRAFPHINSKIEEATGNVLRKIKEGL